MNALTAIAATVYAVTLWMFASESVWEREVKRAKQNQNRPTTAPELKTEPTSVPEIEMKSTQKAIPEYIPQIDTIPEATPERVAIAQPTPEPDTVPTPEPQAIPEAIERAIPTRRGTDYKKWTITKLRDEAKTRKLDWRPLNNGKRKPLNKSQLIELLTT